MVRKSTVATISKDELPKESLELSSKKESNIATRRSGRIRNTNPPPQNKEIQPIVEINVIEDDMAYEMNIEEDPVVNEKTLAEKIDYILQAVDELKSKESRRCPQDDASATDLTYKSLYFDSQKKIETLMKENYELSKKAEVAIGKMEGYGEATRVWSEVLGQVKDMFTVSNLPKATQKIKNVSSPTYTEDLSSPPMEIAEANGIVETQPDNKRKRKPKTSKYN